MSKGRQGGFTLIELSIVLVIIGLIVGGVLTGQSLINAAAVRAQITQIEKYNTAVNTFRDKYGGIPGDLNIADAGKFGFNTLSCTGQQGSRNGNGLIDGGSSGITLAALMGENALFWNDLSIVNLLDGYKSIVSIGNCSGPSVNATSTTIDNYLPAGKIGYGTYVHVYENDGMNWFLLVKITSLSSASSVLNGTPAIPVMQAFNLDKKIDDGVPTSGRVQAVYIAGQQSPPLTQAPNAASDSSTTCYNTATTPAAYSIAFNNGAGPNCALSFQFQ